MKTEKILETEEDKKIFVETISNPPEPNEKLKKAMKTFKEKTNGKS